METLNNAVRKTIMYGDENKIQGAFQVALAGTGNYIPYIGMEKVGWIKKQ